MWLKRLAEQTAQDIASMLLPVLDVVGYDKTWFIRRNQNGLHDLSASEAKAVLAPFIVQSIQGEYKSLIMLSLEEMQPLDWLKFNLRQEGRRLSLYAGNDKVNPIELPPIYQVLDISKKIKPKIDAPASPSDPWAKRRSLRGDPNKHGRIEYGRQVEATVVQQMKKMGYKIELAKGNDDVNGIDAWWDRGQGMQPTQIKYRDSGADIAVVLYSDWEAKKEHTDWKAQVRYYVILSQDAKTLHFADASEVKNLLKRNLESIMRNPTLLRELESGKPFNAGGAMMKINNVPRDRCKKLFGFISPKSLKTLESVPLKEPLLLS